MRQVQAQIDTVLSQIMHGGTVKECISMVTRTVAKAASRLSPLLGLACLFFLIPSLAVSDTFVDGLAKPTGLAIHPNERLLYIKRGFSGTVWKVPISADGTAGGPPVVVTNGFPLSDDIDFDALGNLYGVDPTAGTIVRLTSLGTIETTRIVWGGNQLSGAIAIEPPGLPVNKIYFVVGNSRPDLYSLQIVLFPDWYAWYIGRSCERFRFLHHRLSLNELVGTGNDKLVFVNPTTGECTMLASGLQQASGIAEDLDGNLYVADTLAKTVTKITPLGQVEVIAAGLASPTGLSFDAATGLLFVSETDGGRITTLPAGAATADLSITYNSGSPNPVSVGGRLTYTISVKNNGPDTATGVTLTDRLSRNVTFVSAKPSQGSCRGTSTVTCGLGTLAKGAKATVRIVVTSQVVSAIENRASVRSNEIDPNACNNTYYEVTWAIQP